MHFHALLKTQESTRFIKNLRGTTTLPGTVTGAVEIIRSVNGASRWKLGKGKENAVLYDISKK